MTDRTTAGIEAEPDEVEAVLHNLCGFHLAERDPVARYLVLTREQVLYDALVAAIKRERGRALAELVSRGHRMTEIATLTGLRTRQQVQRLIQLGTAADKASSTQAVDDVQEASRQFDARLAAVEATLDEVVSGIVNEAAPVSPAVGDPAMGGPAMGDPAMGEPAMGEPAMGGPGMSEPAMGERLDSGMTEELGLLNPGVVLTGSGAYPAIVPVVPGVPVGSADPDFDPLTADLEQLTGMLEPTQVMPALSAAMQPTREISRGWAEEARRGIAADDPWRRRTADDDVT